MSSALVGVIGCPVEEGHGQHRTTTFASVAAQFRGPADLGRELRLAGQPRTESGASGRRRPGAVDDHCRWRCRSDDGQEPPDRGGRVGVRVDGEVVGVDLDDLGVRDVASEAVAVVGGNDEAGTGAELPGRSQQEGWHGEVLPPEVRVLRCRVGAVFADRGGARAGHRAALELVHVVAVGAVPVLVPVVDQPLGPHVVEIVVDRVVGAAQSTERRRDQAPTPRSTRPATSTRTTAVNRFRRVLRPSWPRSRPSTGRRWRTG